MVPAVTDGWAAPAEGAETVAPQPVNRKAGRAEKAAPAVPAHSRAEQVEPEATVVLPSMGRVATPATEVMGATSVPAGRQAKVASRVLPAAVKAEKDRRENEAILVWHCPSPQRPADSPPRWHSRGGLARE